MIRTILIDIDTPDTHAPSRRWSSAELSNELSKQLGQPVHVWGEISASEVDAAWRKLRQLSRETEEGATQDNRVHSAHKALSFWQDAFPVRWWQHHRIGDKRTLA